MINLYYLLEKKIPKEYRTPEAEAKQDARKQARKADSEKQSGSMRERLRVAAMKKGKLPKSMQSIRSSDTEKSSKPFTTRGKDRYHTSSRDTTIPSDTRGGDSKKDIKRDNESIKTMTRKSDEVRKEKGIKKYRRPDKGTPPMHRNRPNSKQKFMKLSDAEKTMEKGFRYVKRKSNLIKKMDKIKKVG